MKWWLKLTGCLVLTGILLTACTARQPSAVTPVQEEEVEEGQTLTIVNPENKTTLETNPTVEESKKYQIQTRLTDFKLLSDSSGLAWGATRNELRLYLTQDHGKTWTNISPAASIQFPNSLEFGKDLFFIQSENGWIVRSSLGTGEAIVLRTVDSGLTWKMSTLPDTSSVSAIYFTDSEHGWILSEDSNQLKTLFRTVDGGASWRKIMGTPIISDHAESQMALPKQGRVVSMSFINNSKGFVTLLDQGQPRLYLTQNAGTQWTEVVTFFNPNKYSTCHNFVAGEINFFGDHNSGAFVPVGCIKEGTTKFNGYFSSDAGATWALAPFTLPWQSGANEFLPPVFLNESLGWSIQGTTVLSTTNKGKEWIPLPESKKLTEVLLEYPSIVKLQFYSERVGWLLVSKEDQKRSLLLQTQDGGVTWHVL